MQTRIISSSVAVIDEFEGVANDNVMWATVGFSILSLLMICIMIALSSYNEFTTPDLTICGSIGIYICCGLACKYSCRIINSNRVSRLHQPHSHNFSLKIFCPFKKLKVRKMGFCTMLIFENLRRF